MSDGQDNSWFSDRAKTWMVSVTMTILLGTAAYGYYAGYQWKQERAAQLEILEMNERLQELKEE